VGRRLTGTNTLLLMT